MQLLHEKLSAIMSYAVVQLDGAKAASVVTFGPEPTVLQDVYAFGFPGTAIRSDLDYQAFMKGDSMAVPAVVASTGEVQSLRPNHMNVDVILHNSEISPGNSGGPLTDACGRVVGINTYLSARGAMHEYSMTSDEVMAFLDRRGIAYKVDRSPCVR